ncbi:hypothetical protein NW814_01730 [Synechococcus sp. R65.1]
MALELQGDPPPADQSEPVDLEGSAAARLWAWAVLEASPQGQAQLGFS